MKTHTTQAGTILPLLNLRGKDYLEVKYRLVWFREERPNWSIETEFVSRDEKGALAKATIRDETGRIMATAHKFEDLKGFPDFLEKAETGSMGRAVAILGYGTQFCADEMDEGKRIVDSPREPLSAQRMGVYPEQPEEGEGAQGFAQEYKIDFGKFAGRSLEEVGPDSLRSYVEYLESKAKKDGKTITGKVADFIKRCEDYIGAFENAPTMLR